MTSELQRRTVWGLEPENQLYIKAYLFSAESKTLVAPVKHSSSAKLSSLFLTGKPAPGEHRDRRTKLTLQPPRRSRSAEAVSINLTAPRSKSLSPGLC